MVQSDDVAIAPLVVDVDRSVDFRLMFETKALAGDFRCRVRTAPDSAFNGPQEGFEVGIECRGLFEIDGMARIG